MQKILYISCLSLCLSSVFAKDIILESSIMGDRYKPLTLKATLEQGLRTSKEEQVRALKKEWIESKSTDNFQKTFFPNIELKLSTISPKIFRIRSGGESDANTSPRNQMTLDFGEFVLFNWGKDYGRYKIEQLDLDRKKDTIEEDHRALRHKLISSYSDLVTIKTIEKVVDNKVRQANFIYRLNQDKLKVKKISTQDFYQSRSLYLEAQAELVRAKMNTALADEQMCLLLNDPIGTRYKVEEEIVYRPFKFSLNDSYKFANDQSPTIRDSKLKLEVAHRNYEIEVKENLPLPKFTMNMGANYTQFDNGRYRNFYESYPGDKNIDLVAVINAKWTIFGDGGFFNQRKTQRAWLEKNIAIKEEAITDSNLKTQIRSKYRSILNLEKEIEIYKAKTESSKKMFEIIMENYTNDRTRFSDFRSSLEDFITSESDFSILKHKNLTSKIEYASIIGLEEFPGENMEDFYQIPKDSPKENKTSVPEEINDLKDSNGDQ